MVPERNYAANSNVVSIKNREDVYGIPEKAIRYPEMRYMGSKKRLLPWINQVLDTLDFESAMDPFCGTGSVAYLMKAMGRRVIASDFLNFTSLVARATIENSSIRLDGKAIRQLMNRTADGHNFIENTFSGIFYTREDLKFLDSVSGNIRQLENPYEQALAFAALFRSCLKRQPRGVFTVSGDLSRYDDGRRDLRLTLEEHFLEQIEVYNCSVFDNGRRNAAYRSDVFDAQKKHTDLVYLDPPYVPRSDDNCYVKRYHFIEGLSCYWQGLPIDWTTKVRKIEKKYTPFSYRRTALDAFDRMFSRFSKSKIVLSYSSNGYPNLEELISLMQKYKKNIQVFEKPHRYHFGNHKKTKRSSALEYLIVGT
ncbi:DNA adenine methylase [Stappia sp. TSB10GB4]|uniref:DNA adenine methylase n=1 Tax=Stappia sp. TSB10GB4 TaxID=2003584 RepID=UPI001FCE7E4B|nr:DNA adenine methylase [Stappia sp. TSB10GB4]